MAEGKGLLEKSETGQPQKKKANALLIEFYLFHLQLEYIFQP